MLNQFERRPFLAAIFLIIIAAFIWYISSLPADPAPSIGFKYKAYIYHFGIFFLLSLLSMISFSKGGKNENGKGIAIFFSILYALTDEIHQYFVPGRGVSAGDFITDGLGITLAAVFYNIRLKNLGHSMQGKNLK